MGGRLLADVLAIIQVSVFPLKHKIWLPSVSGSTKSGIIRGLTRL